MGTTPLGNENIVPPAVDTLPLNVAILDSEGTIRWTNQSWQEYGRDRGIGMRPDTLGVNYLEVTQSGDDEFSQRAYDNLTALLAGDIEQFQFEYPCHSEDEFQWFLMQAARYSIAGDQYVAVAHVDITERKERERELRTFEEAADQSGHAIYITDHEGVIRYVNPAFENQTGYDESEAVGQTPMEILQSGEHDEKFYEQLWETITNGEVWENEIINERKDGEQYVVDQTIAPIIDSEGAITHFVAINQEITDRVVYEQRLEEQRDNLELLNQVVRHDIRNDLQLVQTYTELLEDHVGEDGTEYLEKVQESAENAIDLTRTARTLTDVMLKHETETKPVSLETHLLTELDTVQSTFSHAEFTVTDSVSNIDVVANEMLGAVFRNLLQNAIQHNDKDVPEVWVSVTEHDETVDVRIADNGPGVPDARKEEIFGKGEKGLDSSGTGIGLYLVNELVTDYGGDVWVEDRNPQPGQPSADDTVAGSVFVVRLLKA